MNPDLFLADLLAKPEHLRAVAVALDADPWGAVVGASRSVLLLGMGSSHYANLVVAARLRAAGVPAVAELASSDLLPHLTDDTLVVAVSASGGSIETLDAVRRLRAQGGAARFVALTNRAGTELADLCDLRVDVHAGDELGGVACRSYQHTLLLLLALVERLTGVRLDAAGLARRAALASERLIGTRDDWLVPVSTALLGPDGTHVVAPARRIASAYQSALMLREGPRRPAVGSETGDWSHVDVYLTKTTDYRLALLGGSRWEPQLLEWTAQRGSTVVAIGADLSPGAAIVTVRYPGDEDDDLRLVAETLVVELVAAEAWLDRLFGGNGQSSG